MRILTRTQTEAIYEIIQDLKKECDTLKKENDDLRAKITEKDKTIAYLNDKVFAANERYAYLLRSLKPSQLKDIDFPATRPENKTI